MEILVPRACSSYQAFFSPPLKRTWGGVVLLLLNELISSKIQLKWSQPRIYGHTQYHGGIHGGQMQRRLALYSL